MGCPVSKRYLTLSIAMITLFILAAVAYASVKRAEVLRKVSASTVVIHADRGLKIAQGSGTVLGRAGEYSFVVTCHHVIADSTRITLYPTRDENEIYDAFIEVDDPDHDLALLTVKGLVAPVPVMPIAVNAPRMYETVYLFGAPEGETGTASEGIITDTDYEYDGSWFYRVTNAFVAGGISGGTATNLAGEFVGVPARGMVSTTQFGLLIPKATVTKAFGGYLRETH